MATKKRYQRPAYALTLVPRQQLVKAPNYGPFRGKAPANSPARMATLLAGPSAYRLAAPSMDRLRALIGYTAAYDAPAQSPALPEPAQPGADWREPRASSPPTVHGPLGPPMGIHDVAALIGCSPWTVRQTLIPRGLPHFRLGASGRLVFYLNQVVRWILKIQGGSQ
jgi:hypothetical protein